MRLNRDWDQRSTQAAAQALIKSPKTGDAIAISKANESIASSNPITAVVSCRSMDCASKGLRLPTRLMPAEMNMRAVPTYKHALDALT